jgi:hypothetical protein
MAIAIFAVGTLPAVGMIIHVSRRFQTVSIKRCSALVKRIEYMVR